MSIAAREPDDERPYGYEKAEYFSSGTEGGLILLAAGVIIVSAVKRLLNPEPLQSVGVGLLVSAAASAINFGVSLRLRDAGRKYQSITLDADAKHLMTDVWTSVGVIVGVAAVGLTGWLFLDPLVALAVGLNIVRSGYDLVRRSALGLMDGRSSGAMILWNRSKTRFGPHSRPRPRSFTSSRLRTQRPGKTSRCIVERVRPVLKPHRAPAAARNVYRCAAVRAAVLG